MGEPAGLQIPVDEDQPQLTPPQFGTPEFFQWNLELVRNVVAQAMGSMPPLQVVVNTPTPPAPPAPVPTDDDDDDVFIFTCTPVLGHMTHREIYLQRK